MNFLGIGDGGGVAAKDVSISLQDKSKDFLEQYHLGGET